MANVKITQLPSATTPLTGTEVFPLVQGTTTKQVAITGLFTSPVMTNPTLGTVGQADLINATGLPISTGVAGLGTGVATFLGTPSSANLRTAVTDETGTGSLVFATSPTLVTPNLGTPSVLVATNATGTAVGLTAGSAITNANLTGAVTSVGNATSLGSFTSAQLRTALTDETGAGSAVFATSPTITAPILNQINDTNNAQILGLSPTTSAVDYLVVKNGTGVGVPLHFYADGSSANIGLHIQPKGTGLVTISDGTDFNKGIRFRSSSSAASAVTLLDAVSTAGRVVTLPDATTTLVGRDTTDTLTNKTIAFSSNTFSGTLAIANGGTNASTAALAIENLLPAYAGNGSKGLRLNSGATALEWVADGGGTVTSVAASVPSFLSIAGSPITTSGTLAFTLSGTALPTTSGGTGLTSFTSGGVVYASSTSALATGSALTFDGTNLGIGTASPTQKLQVVGNVLIPSGNWFGFGTANERIVGDNTGFMQFFASGAERIRIDTAGNVGIGTITPTQKLQVAGSVLASSGSWYGWGDANERIVGDNTGFMQYFVDGTEQMRLTSTGLGIGTSSPSTKLHVSGGASSTWVTVTGQSYDSQFGSDSVGTFIGNFTTKPIYFATNSTEKMRLDSAGNLGLGVTPSAWNTSYKGFQVGSVTALWGISSGAGGSFLSNNVVFDTTSARKYLVTGTATEYVQASGAHSWYTAASGTAGNAISFTQAMTLDASGNLGVGATSIPAGFRMYASGGSMLLDNNTAFRQKDSVGNNTLIFALSSGNNLEFGSGQHTGGLTITTGNSNITFTTNSAERARIDSSGNLLVAATTVSESSSTGVRAKSNGQLCSTLAGSTDSTDTLDVFSTGANAYRFYVGMGGTIFATSIVITAISDQRLKENVRDIDTGLNSIMALKPRRFDWKEGKGQDKKNVAGFIAQEFENVFPECVSTSKAGGDGIEYKNINHETLIPTLVKAMQEQQAIIESLKARLDAANL